MVLVVVHGGVDPFSEPMFIEALRIDLPAEVTIDVIDDRHQKEQKEMQDMHGYRKQEYDEDPDFYDGFQWVEGISGPW